MRLASIDIGTNSTRFLVAEVENDGLSLIKSGLMTTRLGQGINHGKLLIEAMERTVEAIEAFLGEIATHNPRAIILAATSAVRDAGNKDEFLQLVLARTGLQVKVYSGEKEAAASYHGVLSGLPLVGENTVVLDVGGGSTEFIWQNEQGIRYVSLPLGAVRMTEGAYSEENMREIMATTLGKIKDQLKGNVSLVAVGGTATTLAAMSLGSVTYQPELVHGYFLTTEEIKRLLKLLLETNLEDRKKIVGLQPQRADIIPAGVTIVKNVVEGLSLAGLTVSESDILQGLILELYQELSQ
ncbi:Ppx/GppA phosphatase family protein [Desulfotomaculum sp. 1211_IL3151]|uniref:Ppx/GppA phosphatase family protein n=1 Tax=Desulfotomaculum sp. 1211_IL3151 TaxID=3084055 RepID=UPI002FDA560C